jgi:putative glutamine amidotransferase
VLRPFVVSLPPSTHQEIHLPAPLIGVTTYSFTSNTGHPQFALNQAYIKSLHGAGACPLLIPSRLAGDVLQTFLSRLDGVLFSGGGDVRPERYGSQPHPLVTEIDEDRDELEIELVRQVAQAGLPFLGICRGLQVINVALGGSLYEDILEQRPDSLKHQNVAEHPRDYLAHSIQVQPGSRLAGILGGTDVQVNSLHHQGIRRLAPGLAATAHAPDGVIEAVELPEHPFGLAVQWHPECIQAYPPMQSLFRAFVEACQP